MMRIVLLGAFLSLAACADGNKAYVGYHPPEALPSPDAGSYRVSVPQCWWDYTSSSNRRCLYEVTDENGNKYLGISGVGLTDEIMVHSGKTQHPAEE